jgi:hypothetical protein
VPPRTLKEGASCHISNPATSGAQYAGKPRAYEGGQNGGSRGAKPPWRGLWGVSPHKTKIRGELPTLATPPRVGPNTPANQKPTRVGKTGGPGGHSPPGGGLWGVSPHKTKIRGGLPTLATPPRVGPNTLANPEPTRVGKRGVQGGTAPLAGGRGGCPPQNQN